MNERGSPTRRPCSTYISKLDSTTEAAPSPCLGCRRPAALMPPTCNDSCAEMGASVRQLPYLCEHMFRPILTRIWARCAAAVDDLLAADFDLDDGPHNDHEGPSGVLAGPLA